MYSPAFEISPCPRSVLQYSLNTFSEVRTDMVWLTYLHIGIIITKNYQRMNDSDYNALRIFFQTNWSHNFLGAKSQLFEKSSMQNQIKKVENIILHASIKISENFNINHLRWSKVAACNLVKNGLNHKCFFVSWKFAEQNSDRIKKSNGPKVQHK